VDGILGGAMDMPAKLDRVVGGDWVANMAVSLTKNGFKTRKATRWA
jgi:hypothetical protein